MGISVTTSPQQITAAVGESKIDVSVSGGFGPSGAAGSNGQAATVAVGTVTTGAAGSQAAVTNVGSSSAAVLNFTIPAGATGATGPQGPAGAAGASAWGDITGKPSTFTPSSHTHDYVEVAGSSTYTNFLTTAGNLGGALSEIDGELTARALAADFDQGLKTTDSVTFQDITFNGDLFVPGLTAGRVLVSNAGFVGYLTIGTSGQALVVNSGATGVEWATLSYAAVSHAHGAITSDGKVGSTAGLVLKTGTAGAVEALAQGTAGQVLKVNGTATGVEWGAAAADVSIDTTAADILSATSGAISADDAGADKLVFWDDSAGKLTYLAVSTGLSISGTTITAAGAVTVTSPSQITSNQNDYAGATADINRISSNAARDITGIAAGTDGQALLLINVGSFAITLKHQSTSSTAANRIIVPWGNDYAIPADGSATLVYDDTTDRWRVL